MNVNNQVGGMRILATIYSCQSFSNLVWTLKDLKDPSQDRQRPKDYGLTQRETQLIRAVVSGYTNKEIASQFSISEQTVKHHVTSIFNKFGVYNRLELTLFVLHHGLAKKWAPQ